MSQGHVQAAAAGLALAIALAGCGGSELEPGTIEGAARPASALRAAERSQDAARDVLAAQGGKAHQARILFGDLHVHTTYSIDAYLYGLPLFGGEGAHPPADACDFARYCSALDFFSLNDHAEGLTPERWQNSLDSLRECNARAGDPADPDLVAYVGWEWTQTGKTPETHFGHKNVVYPGLADDELPARPISSLSPDVMSRARYMGLVRAVEAVAALPAPEYADFLWWIRKLADTPLCDPDVPTRELPADCQEAADTPERLFAKLAEWKLEHLVIPHGLTWGVHAPPGANLAVQLTAARHAPGSQRLLEIYSGHGAAETYQPAAARADADGRRGICTQPTADFLPCCWQAGEIIRARCADPRSDACEERVTEARTLALAAGRHPHWTIPDASGEDWLDCDQVRGAFKPAFAGRPDQSAQFALSVTNPAERDAQGRPLRFRFGLIASSDIHSARAGTGYKQMERHGMSDVRGIASERLRRWLRPFVNGRQADPQRAQASPPVDAGFRSLLDVERGASFLYPGGLVAVHARARDRRSIWDALMRREVYGTSGPRILLWFDLLNGPQGRAPMGSEVRMAGTPRFEVRAVGSRVQQPGCPEESVAGLSAGRLERLCRGECYNPGSERYRIIAIEVVRIRPGAEPGQPAGSFIDDPWRRFPCPDDRAGCIVRFEDPEAPPDAVYYVRALQEQTPAINGANLRTRFDADGRAVSVEPCYGDARTDLEDDCLAPVQERAWSSPIFLEREAS